MSRFFLTILLFVLVACDPTHEVATSDSPCLIPFHDYDFRLCENFIFEVDGVHYAVPAHFVTDLASVPRILWSLYSPSKTETIPAAIIHDYLYFCPGEFTRDEIDSIFHDFLLYNNTAKATAFKYWLAVRLFGGRFFHEATFCHTTKAGTTNSSGHMRVGALKISGSQ